MRGSRRCEDVTHLFCFAVDWTHTLSAVDGQQRPSHQPIPAHPGSACRKLETATMAYHWPEWRHDNICYIIFQKVTVDKVVLLLWESYSQYSLKNVMPSQVFSNKLSLQCNFCSVLKEISWQYAKYSSRNAVVTKRPWIEPSKLTLILFQTMWLAVEVSGIQVRI